MPAVQKGPFRRRTHQVRQTTSGRLAWPCTTTTTRSTACATQVTRMYPEYYWSWLPESCPSLSRICPAAGRSVARQRTSRKPALDTLVHGARTSRKSVLALVIPTYICPLDSLTQEPQVVLLLRQRDHVGRHQLFWVNGTNAGTRDGLFTANRSAIDGHQRRHQQYAHGGERGHAPRPLWR